MEPNLYSMEIRERADAVVEEIDGIRVTKRFDDEEYALPSVILEFESHRSNPVTVTVREPVSDSVSVAEIGFHQNMGADHWDVTDQHLEFEYVLDPYEQYRTVYAYRADTTIQLDELLTSPDTIEVELDDEEMQNPRLITRSSAESPYLDGAVQTTDGEEEPNAGGVDLGDADVADGESSTEPESLLDELAEEIESGTASTESLDILRATIVAESESSGSSDAGLRKLENDVSNLRAYTTALTGFLDENGSAIEIIESVEHRLDSMEAELESLQSITGQLKTAPDSLESELRAVDESVESAERELRAMAEEMDAVRQDVQSVETRVPIYEVKDRIESVEDELATVRDFVDDLRTDLE